MATQGSPAKFSYAITEREDSPWEPLHVALGFKPDQSVVTVFGGEGPHNVNDHVSTTAPGILNNVADVATTLGSNVGWYLSQSQILVVLGPEHAATIAADGFTRADVQRFVFENARMPLGRMKLGGMWGMHDWPTWMAKETDESVRLPRVPAVEDVYVMVGGGSASTPAWCPTARSAAGQPRPRPHLSGVLTARGGQEGEGDQEQHRARDADGAQALAEYEQAERGGGERLEHRDDTGRGGGHAAQPRGEHHVGHRGGPDPQVEQQRPARRQPARGRGLAEQRGGEEQRGQRERDRGHASGVTRARALGGHRVHGVRYPRAEREKRPQPELARDLAESARADHEQRRPGDRHPER